MREVDVGNLPCFSQESRLVSLNKLIKVNDDLMPHQVAVNTGCGYDNALMILLLLYNLGFAQPYLLVYHVTEPDLYIFKRDFVDGFPPVPFICPNCQKEITERAELIYDFQFDLNYNDIRFTRVTNGTG